MTREEKLDLIAGLEGAYSRVDALLEGAGSEERAFVPPLRDAWSIDDFLVHFLDADLSLCFRLRSAVAEPGKNVPLWDEVAWHGELRYGAHDGPACLGLAKSLRSFVAAGLRAVVDEDWSTYRVVHETKGELSLEDLVAMYAEHIAFHLPLIKRNRLAWQSRKV